MSQAHQEKAPDTAGVVAPPPLIALATVVAGLVMDWLYPLFFLGGYFTWTVRLVVGFVLIAAGALLAIVAERSFSRFGTNALALATGGIYRRLRNPMYVGLCLIVAGIGIALGSEWTLLMLVPMALILHHGVVLREERYLEAKFGDDYRRYKAAVPRYGWPR